MGWDDLRFVMALSKGGSLARAAKVLEVDHTTVGRRIEAAERWLGVRLFTRTTAGYVPTADAERLLQPMGAVEDAVLAVERAAHANRDALEGPVRVTSPETLGISYLAPRLAAFGSEHPGLEIELLPGGEVLDLHRREAELAVRPFRSSHESLVVRRVAELTYGLYASTAYLARRPLRTARDLCDHAILSGVPGPKEIEARWLKRLTPGIHIRPAFVSTLSSVLLGAARASAGVAILPRYLGDAEPTLRHIAMPDEPKEALWLTVRRDLRHTPRVRAVLDFLASRMKDDAPLFRGRR